MIRVLVVDDHPVVRQGLMAILRFKPDIDLVGEAADGLEAVQLILERRPDVVLLDLRLPQLSGIEVMRRVRAQVAQVHFLVLTTYDTDAYIAPALAAGAHGYLLKDATPDELVHAIRSLAQGGAALEAGVAARLLERVAERSSGDELSARELDVLHLLVRGDSNKAIATQLTLSENTVRTHISHILQKLDAQSRGEAVAIALKHGLVRIDTAS